MTSDAPKVRRRVFQPCRLIPEPNALLGPVAEGVVVGGVVAGLGEASGVSRVVSSHHVIKPEASGAQDRRTR